MPVFFNDNTEAIIRQLEDKKKDALKDVGQLIERDAKLRSPVDTGLLRGSIEHQLYGFNTVKIGTKVRYAVYVEKGTRKNRAQPFLTPAFEQNLMEIKRIFEMHLSQVGGN